MILAALALAAATPVAARVDAVATGANLAGVVLVAKGDTVLVERGYGVIEPGGTKRHDPKARWRLASISKQVTAAMLVRDAAAGKISLDSPLGTTIGHAPLGEVTTRMLLQHHSGLANPDDTPKAANGFPSFYTTAGPKIPYCLSKPGVANAPFSYNNCDYLVASIMLGTGDTESGQSFWPRGIRMPRRGDAIVPGFVAGKPEPAYLPTAFGPAGGLTGTARDVLAFDRSLMTGKLLPSAALNELWKPEGNGSYQALGQWVFPGQLKGCAKPKRIVQRDGEIQGVQTRNFILPDDDMVAIVFTNRSSDDFKFGEVWEGSGFVYDLLSAVACA